MSPVERLPPRPAPSGPPEPHLNDSPSPERSAGFAGEPDADAEPPFATLPDISERDLQADTLAFERVGRREPSSWTWLKLTLVLAVVGGAGAGAWRIWGEDLMRPTGDEIPTVRALDGPFKVRPDAPGGAEIPNRDKLVYERLDPGKAPPERPETLRPRPEAPLPPPEAAADASEEGSPQMVEGPGSEQEEAEAEAAAAAAGSAAAPEAAAAASEPASPPAAPAPAKPPAPTAAAPSPEQVKAAVKPAPPPPPPAVKSEEANVAAGVSSRAYRIQLGAVRSEAAARGEWARLRKQNESLLGRLTLNVERADLGAKGVFFRIQAGPFADRGAADTACAELAKNKVPCLPIRPES